MTAKEMFEKLGYFPSYDYKTNKKEIAFYGKGHYQIIVFDLIKKKIEIIDKINKQELQAINKQVEELGWNK